MVIGKGAFRFCNELKYIYGGVVGEGRLEVNVGEVAFQGCTQFQKFSDININSLGTFAFQWCEKLTNYNGYWNLTAKDIPECAFEGCENLYIIDLSQVETIGANAFKNSGVTKIDLSSIKTVGDDAFYNSKVSEIFFDYSTREGKFGSNCFALCTS